MKLLDTLLQVYRTSTRWDKNTPPCEGAVRHQVKGTKLTYVHWTIRFATLTELEAFIAKHGEVVITPPDPKSIVPSRRDMGAIEIYDNYRE